jgi:hypothetical protein
MNVREEAAYTSIGRQEATRIYAEHKPMSREAAAEHLAANGLVPGQDGKRVDGPPDRTAADYNLPADAPISGDDFAKLKIDTTLAGVILRDLGAKIDQEAVKAHFGRTGQSYTGAIADVTAMLASAGVKTINAASLSAHTLALLAATARHQAKLLARPKA